MMPIWARSAMMIFSPGPCPWTSAEGLSTRRYSAGRLNRLPSSNSMSSRFSAFLRRSSTGQGALRVWLTAVGSWRRRARCRDLFVVAQRAGLVDQHNGDAVADRVGEAGLVADQLLRRAVVTQRRLGQRADQDFEEL